MALLVPVALDALLLSEHMPVPGPMMDFSKTPWSDGTRDHNGDSPYISETLYRQPFDDSQHYLKKGLHLHWALPDALTRSLITENGTTFPNAPNRWLIVRSGGGLSEREWLIESDYLFPPGKGKASGAITIPFQGASNEQPFRYMGRNYPLRAELTSLTGETYLETLTAVGWGDAAFAAFYPNCSSVFGFLDDDVTFTPDDTLNYKVIGYYSDATKDPYAKFIQEYAGRNGNSSVADVFQAVLEAFNWQVGNNAPSYVPTESVYVAELTFSETAISTPNSKTSSDPITIANTGTEALSAFLANQVDPANRAMIEEQLEAVQMSAQLSTMQLDVLANFNESRHTKGFSAIDAGTIWDLDVKLLNNETANAEASQNAQNTTIPEEISRLLQKANALQNEYDRATHEWKAMQKQLFADWHKYMAASYPPDGIDESFPPIDLIRLFISEKEMKSLVAHQERTGAGALRFQLENNKALISAGVADNQIHGFAGQTAFALNELLDAVNQFNESQTAVENGMVLSVTAKAAPRFWVPNEPVVCISGDDAQATNRHGADGALICYNDSQFNNQNLTTGTGASKEVSSSLLNKIDDFFDNYDPESIGINVWERQPWNPILMEWEAAFMPLSNRSNVASADRNYSSDFISSNYDLLENAPDFSLKASAGSVIPAANLYVGSTVMTPYASKGMNNTLVQALNDFIMPEYYGAQEISPSDDYLLDWDNIQSVLNWYTENKIPNGASESDKAADPVYSILRAYSINFDWPSLTQSLGGFNQAMIQLEQTPQLDIAEPIGFQSNQMFTQKVSDLVGNQRALAPLPLNDFNPIRSGRMSLMRLRLVDSFGQFKDFSTDSVGKTELMNEISLLANQVCLAPRIIQPVRLNFRWLDAQTDEEEMTLQPVTSPVCGWMLPNHLDASLFFYNQAGEALGYIDAKARWQPAPGSDSAIYQVEKIENEHLLRVVNYLLLQGPDFFSDYLITINSAQDNIDPENYASVDSLSVLMGQPIAVVRAHLNLELCGGPVVNQGWPVFHQDLSRNYRSTDRFEAVRFPVRIGEYNQLNDGTIGYWIEEGGSFKDDVFYSPEGELNANELIAGHGESDFEFELGPTTGNCYLTLLLDPRGKLHATCGIVPVKELEIPSVHYAQAMSQMEVSFLSAPVLTTDLKMTIPFSAQAGYAWSWVERTRFDWNVVRDLNPPREGAVFEGSQKLVEGWMKLKPKQPIEHNEENDNENLEPGFTALGFDQPNN